MEECLEFTERGEKAGAGQKLIGLGGKGDRKLPAFRTR